MLVCRRNETSTQQVEEFDDRLTSARGWQGPAGVGGGGGGVGGGMGGGGYGGGGFNRQVVCDD